MKTELHVSNANEACAKLFLHSRDPAAPLPKSYLVFSLAIHNLEGNMYFLFLIYIYTQTIKVAIFKLNTI